MKTKALRDSVKNALKEASGIPVFHRFALALAKPPFLVFSLMMMSHGETIDRYDLMVDLSDYGTEEESTIDDIADRVAEELDAAEYLDGELSWVSYLSNYNIIEETDKNIQRRRLNFEIRLIERN